MKKGIRIIITAIAIVACWQGLIAISKTPPYILPTPAAVFSTLWENLAFIAEHTYVTALEIILGLIVGSVFGVLFALVMDYSSTVRYCLHPAMLISQAIPIYALGPVLMLWFGFGLLTKIIIITLLIFFPVTSATYDGLRATPLPYLRLAKTMGSNRLRCLLHIRLPAALPSFASGMRVSATYASFGAIIGEYAGGSDGLGFFIRYCISRMQTDLAFAALLAITLLTMSVYYSVNFLLNKYINWRIM